ncbi:MAG TPA: hypothetical protein VGT05_00920 [Patescibacteria group bacterium]|nr:hypothetical protein [Patescibacteria group bacterium]
MTIQSFYQEQQHLPTVPFSWLKRPRESVKLEEKQRRKRAKFSSKDVRARQIRISLVMKNILQNAEKTQLPITILLIGSGVYRKKTTYQNDIDIVIICDELFLSKDGISSLLQVVNFPSHKIFLRREDEIDLYKRNIHTLNYVYSFKGIPHDIVITTFEILTSLFSEGYKPRSKRTNSMHAITREPLGKETTVQGEVVYLPSFFSSPTNHKGTPEYVRPGMLAVLAKNNHDVFSYTLPHMFHTLEPKKSLYDKSGGKYSTLEKLIWKKFLSMFLDAQNLLDTNGKPLLKALSRQYFLRMLKLFIRYKGFSSATKEQLILRYIQEVEMFQACN